MRTIRTGGQHVRYLARVMGMSLLIPTAANAAITTYTDSATFFAALGGGATLVDFEDAPAGTEMPDPAVFGPLSLSLGLGDEGIDLMISDVGEQTTPGGSNALGVNTPDEFFLSSDALGMSFSNPANALGLFVIGSIFDVEPGDFSLTFGGNSVVNNATPEATLADGEVFFLGLIETGTAVGYASATLTTVGDANNPFYSFNVDDVAYRTIPVPPAVLLLALPAALLARRRPVVSVSDENAS